MSSYSKKVIERKFNCILDKLRAMDSGNIFWVAHEIDSDSHNNYGEHLGDAYTLEEMYELLSKKKDDKNKGGFSSALESN